MQEQLIEDQLVILPQNIVQASMSYGSGLSKLVTVSLYLVVLDGVFFHTLTHMHVIGICEPVHIFSIQETRSFTT